MIAALLAAWALSPLFAGIDNGFRSGKLLFGPSHCPEGIAIGFFWKLSDAVAIQNPCFIRFNVAQFRHYDGADICQFAIHEYGHQTGRRHSPNRRDIMFWRVPMHPRLRLCKR